MPILDIILAAIILLLAILLLVQRKKITMLKAGLDRLDAQSTAPETEPGQREAAKAALLQAADTIHLYAALSAEEAQSSALKERQAEILRASEAIIRTLEP